MIIEVMKGSLYFRGQGEGRGRFFLVALPSPKPPPSQIQRNSSFATKKDSMKTKVLMKNPNKRLSKESCAKEDTMQTPLE